MKRTCLGYGPSVGTFPRHLLLPLQLQEPSEGRLPSSTHSRLLTCATHSRYSLAQLGIYTVGWGSPDSEAGTEVHQLVISDLEGGFSYDSYRFQSGTPKKRRKEKKWGFMYDVWYGAVFYSGTWGLSRRSTLIVIETCVWLNFALLVL